MPCREQGIHDQVMRCFDIVQQALGHTALLGVGFCYFLQRVGRFADSGYYDEQRLPGIPLQDTPHMPDGMGIFERGPAKFEHINIFFHKKIKNFILKVGLF